ncbi:hypothetical protein KFL_000500280 [Klebsormidium nitens]|uniref:Uncharacterized protein n=1 Tax=Klebsormidium nitens TaxID=105231 RepID=A0A1Y1HNQ2_KLENI|nr:hypothetical protein KFL_000500280 [Klebsormidium nitens]|eukprot:GAQ80275.1 hypothetical protein KFL_000500280 [Klebsormidium nitens]
MANAVGGAFAGAFGSVAIPLQALQSFVQVYNDICVARKAMTFNEERGEQLKNRVRFVSHQLQRKYQILEADIQAGRLRGQDAELFAERVMAFRAVLVQALTIITRCKGNKLYRSANAKSIKEDIVSINVQITDCINDMHLPSISFSSSSTSSNESEILERTLSNALEDSPSSSGISDEGSSSAPGPSAKEIENLKGYATRQLQLLGLFTNQEIMAFTEYVQAVVRGYGMTCLHNKMATDLPFATLRSPGPVFCPATLPPRLNPAHRSPVSALAVRIDTGDVFSGHRNGVVCMWMNGVCAAVFGAQSAVPVTALLVMPDGTLVVGNGRGGLRARSTDPPYADMPSTDYEQPGAITALAASDGGVLFSGDLTGGIVVWAPGFSAPRPYLKAHVKAVTALCVTPRNDSDQVFAFSGGADGKIRAWAFPELVSPPWDAHFEVRSCGGPVRALALSADASALYSVRGKGHVARWAVPGADKKCALEISQLGGGPLAVTERGLLLGAANHRCHVAAWHVGELTPENVQFLKQSSDPKRPIPCGGAGLLLGDSIYGRGKGTLGPLDEITVIKVVEIGAPGAQALLVTGHKDGGVRISKVASW